nr:putative cardiolipin synthase [Ipomoea batatas]
MAGRANNLLASVFTPPPPKPKFAGISTRRVSFLHNRTCFSIATKAPTIPRKICLQIRRSSLTTPSSQDPVLEEDSSSERSDEDGGGENGGDDGEGWSWTLSFLLFGFWAGLMYYVLILAPNQTPSTDLYFLKKLLNLKGDDGFRMNDVLVAEWYIMGLWPLVYSMLLLPTARTPKCSVPVWPFLVLSCIGGAYALFPFFILWKPPPPPVEETELRRWPLNFLESKLTAGILLASGLGLIVYAGISTGDWKEFYQYFRQSRFVQQGFLASSCVSLSILGSCIIPSPTATSSSSAGFLKPEFFRRRVMRRPPFCDVESGYPSHHVATQKKHHSEFVNKYTASFQMPG